MRIPLFLALLLLVCNLFGQENKHKFSDNLYLDILIGNGKEIKTYSQINRTGSGEDVFTDRLPIYMVEFEWGYRNKYFKIGNEFFPLLDVSVSPNTLFFIGDEDIFLGPSLKYGINYSIEPILSYGVDFYIKNISFCYSKYELLETTIIDHYWWSIYIGYSFHLSTFRKKTTND